MVLEGVKQWWNDFKTKFATRTEEQITRKNLEKVNEGLDRDRGYARGREKQEERKRKELEDSVTKDREKNVSQHLHKQKEQLKANMYKDATSLKRLMQIAEREGINLLSRDMQEEFGEFDDIWIMQNGQLGIVSKEGEVKFTGRQTTDIFRNPGGLRNEVMNGFISLNSNKDGQPVESIENQQVPDLITGPNGEMTFTETYQQQYLEKVGQYKSQLNQARQKQRAMEKAFVRLSEKVNDLVRDLETTDALNESLRTQLDRRKEEFENVVKQFDNMQRQTSRMSHHKQMSEDLFTDTLRKLDDVEEELTDRLDDDELSEKEDEIKRIANLAGDLKRDLVDVKGMTRTDTEKEGG